MDSAAEAKQAQLAELRRRMAAIPARGVESTARAPMSGPRPVAAARAVAADLRPPTEELRPAAEELRPLVDGRQSPDGGLRRPADELRPVAGESRLVAGESLAAVGESQASVEELRPARGESRSVVGGSRSAAEMWRPVVEERRSVAGVARREPLPVPSALENLLPEGGLAKGSVVLYSGANSLLSGLLAAVTGSGGHAAVVGMPRFGLLAAAEMGARLDRLAIVTNPGSDPLEVASVLLDGLDLVILGLNGASVPMSRTRVLTARARSKGSTLVVTGGSWAGPVLRIDTRVTGYSGLGRGCGRLRTVLLDVSVHSRSAQPRTGHLALCPSNGRVEWVDTNHDAAEPLTPTRHAVS